MTPMHISESTNAPISNPVHPTYRGAFRMLGVVAFILFLFLGIHGCSAPLGPVVYSGPETVNTQLTAMIGYKPGIVTGGQKDSGEGPFPKFYFGEEDQRVFVESLTAELNRIGLLDAVFGGGGPARENDAYIHIIFTETFHDPEDQNYYLDVMMKIRGAKHEFVREYQVNSHDSFWESLATTAASGKKKAAENLMLVLVKDLSLWAEREVSEEE